MDDFTAHVQFRVTEGKGSTDHIRLGQGQGAPAGADDEGIFTGHKERNPEISGNAVTDDGLAPGDLLLPAALGLIRQLGEGVNVVEIHFLNICHVRRDVAWHGNINQKRERYLREARKGSSVSRVMMQWGAAVAATTTSISLR